MKNMDNKNSSRNKETINPIPEGVWESSRPKPEKEKGNKAAGTTDLQGNGYPKQQNK